ncbi:cysteine hydrolase family protein [Paenibacillus sp. 1001270B_150601_E10]|uniref:cysteine hydrolase family protein n=1 Tax=Paenibacillus sp. 1001270B_150601_E10 TaxID=2787079 RepID=UPI00189F29E8|nr:cysteine hydrolase family protein [Paenibacillus sp. 1001270B_150601_E10]
MSSNQALIIIDVQNGMFVESDPVFEGDALLHKLQTLIKKARLKRIPIFYIQHNEEEGYPLEQGSEGWLIHPAVEPQEQDILVQKFTPDAFHETSLKQELDRQQIDELVLAGIQTDLCVDTTCRRAASLGYKVTLVKDAHSTWPSGELTAEQIIRHHNQVLKWFSIVKSIEEVYFDCG